MHYLSWPGDLSPELRYPNPKCHHRVEYTRRSLISSKAGSKSQLIILNRRSATPYALAFCLLFLVSVGFAFVYSFMESNRETWYELTMDRARRNGAASLWDSFLHRIRVMAGYLGSWLSFVVNNSLISRPPTNTRPCIFSDDHAAIF